MTDWGDAILNEKARPRTWPAPPPTPPPLGRAGAEVSEGVPAAPTEEERQVPRAQPPDPPLTRHDKGERLIPTKGGS
jgi:hypothetical protein